jgi:hypothetical protein
MGILWAFYGHFMGILWAFYGHFMGIIWAFAPSSLKAISFHNIEQIMVTLKNGLAYKTYE